MKTINNLNADEPPSSYSSFEKKIFDYYIECDDIINTIRKHSFEATLYPVLTKVNEYIISSKFDAIPSIVGTLLTTINDKLVLLEGNEKIILEELASELFKGQISILNSSQEGQECWKKCLPILRETCEFKGYDFESLSKLVGISFVKKIENKNTIILDEICPYYEWLGEKEQFENLIHVLKDKKWINNKVEFKKIFSPSIKPDYKFSAPSENKVKLLVLFSELKQSNLITTKRNKGHLFPLFKYGVDFDNKLYEKEPKRYLEILKRKKVEYNSVLNEIQKIIRINLT